MDSLMGFRFKPTDNDITDFLKQKRLDPDFCVPTIKELNIYKCEPCELPGFCEIQSKEEVWYFCCEPYYKYANSKRAHRRTKTGYWKVTGQGSKLKAKNSCEVIGTKKILTFCSNINTGSKKANTKWVMHEIAIGDDPLYKKDFVVCRLERKRVTKLGISTHDEDQPCQELTYCSSIDVTKYISSESDLPLDQPMVSNRNHIAENIFSKTDKLISQSRNHVAENTSLESILPPPNQHLVSNRNHVAENTCAEPQVFPSYNWVSSYSRNHVAEITGAEFQLPASRNFASYSKNHVAEFASPEWQQLENDLISYSRNHVAENAEFASPEWQQLPNDFISYSRNHVAENASLEYMLPPPNQHLVSNRNHVAENTCPEYQVPPSHSSVSSYFRNHIAEITATESQLLASQNLASYSRNHVAAEWQQLANHTSVSYSRNHVAENSSAELRIVPNDDLESLILPNQQSSATNFVECTFEAGPRPLPEFNPHSGYTGVINASFPALQSLIYPQQESSYSNCSCDGCNLLNSQFYSDQGDDLSDSLWAFQNDSLWAFQIESSREEPRQAFTPDFNSSKSDGGVYVENGFDADTLKP